MKTVLCLIAAAMLCVCSIASAEPGPAEVPMDYTAREDQSAKVDDLVWLYYGLITVNLVREGLPVQELLQTMEERHIYARELAEEGVCCTLTFLEDYALRIYRDGQGAVSGLSVVITCPEHHHAFEISVDLKLTYAGIMNGSTGWSLWEEPVYQYQSMVLPDDNGATLFCLLRPHRLSSAAATAVFHAFQITAASMSVIDVQLAEKNWTLSARDFLIESKKAGKNYLWTLLRDEVSAFDCALALYIRSGHDGGLPASVALTMTTPPLVPDLFAFLQDESWRDRHRTNSGGSPQQTSTLFFPDSMGGYFSAEPVCLEAGR